MGQKKIGDLLHETIFIVAVLKTNLTGSLGHNTLRQILTEEIRQTVYLSTK